MDTVLQKKLLSVFHYALNPSGFLVLGQAETVGAQATLFSLADKKFRIHRKKESSALLSMTFPVDYSVAGLPRKKTPPCASRNSKLSGSPLGAMDTLTTRSPGGPSHMASHVALPFASN